MPRPPLPIAEHPRQGRRRASSCTLRLALVCGWLVLGAILILIGPSCSAEKKYKVLSLFFDGVPDPNAPQMVDGSEPSAPGTAPKMLSIVHKPYADGKCGDCHEGDMSKFESFQKLSSDVCMKCHAKVINQFPVMHGPVSAGECLLCHNPHESGVKHLLNDNAPAVCVQCHVSELLSPNPPEHQDPKKSCLDCHTAHGGDKHGLLLTTYLHDRPSTQAATQPTTQATSQPSTAPTTPSNGGSTP